MSIRNRLILLIALLLALLAFTGFFAYRKFSTVTRQLSQIGEGSIRLSNKVVFLNLQHLRHTDLFKKVVEQGLLLQSQPAQKAAFISAREEYGAACMMFDNAVHSEDTLLSGIGGYETVSPMLGIGIKRHNDSIIALHNICAPTAGRVFAMLEEGNSAAALPVADSLYDNEKKIHAQLNDLLVAYQDFAARAITLSRHEQHRILLDLLGIIGIIAAIGIAGALFLSRQILVSLGKAVWFAGQIKEGNRMVDFGTIPRDEVGGLLSMLREMLAALKTSEQQILDEKKKSDDLLLNILPAEVAEELKKSGSAIARHFDEVTVLFTDFKGFTLLSEQLTPQELVNELDACFGEFDAIMVRHGIEKIKTIGDAYLAAAGVPEPCEQHARIVVTAALEIVAYMRSRKERLGDRTFDIRVGIHTGDVVAGIVGVKKFAYDIWGDTVNTAARMEQNSEAGRINISQATYDRIKDDFHCTYRGTLPAKNKGNLPMYFVDDVK
jgi:class 3 adenylate cyclase